MKNIVFVSFLLCCSTVILGQQQPIELWQTNADKSILFEKMPFSTTFQADNGQNIEPTIFIDDTKTFQTMDGFGFTLTGGSATLINKMSETAKNELLMHLFATNDKNIGISYLRISVGASDLSEKVYSYHDVPKGEQDITLSKFDISEEKKDLIPILKAILKINPTLKIMASPWSPPTWMKTNGESKGGSLKPEFYDAYAQYLVKYIQSMKKEGIHIDALTLQNEPLHPGNNPSLLMYAYQEADFVKKSLGVAFKKAKIKTKILVYDHNADRPDYPIQVLNDKAARKYIDGSAFHLYGGVVEAIGDVHNAHPDKNLYFTEQWTGSKGSFDGDLLWHTHTLMINAPRNWCKTVLEWNLAIDPDLNPHTDGGCTECLGALTIDGDKVRKNVSYYIVAHASKFVRPNSVRIASNHLGDLPNVAYKTPQGKIVLLLQNNAPKAQNFKVSYKNRLLEVNLAAKSVGTLVF